jgi:sporulation protein YlmC with PRC-barrel domain
MGKQVITRTSGRSLGTISGCWMDPSRATLVSFDLQESKSSLLSTPQRAGNIPLASLRQIGDVVLVHDESGLYEQDLDGRMGFVDPLGLEVRTRAGEFLGKVRTPGGQRVGGVC